MVVSRAMQPHHPLSEMTVLAIPSHTRSRYTNTVEKNGFPLRPIPVWHAAAEGPCQHAHASNYDIVSMTVSKYFGDFESFNQLWVFSDGPRARLISNDLI